MNNPVDQPKVGELTEAGVRSILESLGDDTFAGCERRSTMSVRQQRALCNLALSALIGIPGAEYTPAILEMDREGDPCWEFVERDCLTVTGVVFAANVEQLFDADHQLIGFRIFKPSAGPGAEKGEAVAWQWSDFSGKWYTVDTARLSLAEQRELAEAVAKDHEGRVRALYAAPTSERVQATHRHVKRGSEYVLIGYGKMQAESWADAKAIADALLGLGEPVLGDTPNTVDMREVAIYRSVDDGSLWVRPREEFEDGRFAALLHEGQG